MLARSLVLATTCVCFLAACSSNDSSSDEETDPTSTPSDTGGTVETDTETMLDTGPPPESDAASDVRSRDALADTASPDTSKGDTGQRDAGSSPEPETYYVSYLAEDLTGNDDRRALKTYATKTGEKTVVNPDAVTCSDQQTCRVTDDMSTFVYTKRGSSFTEKDVYTARIGNDLKAAGEGSMLLEGVRDVTVEGNYLVYARSSGSDEVTIHYRKLPNGNEKTFTSVSERADWFVDPEHDVAVVYDTDRPGQLPVEIGPLDNWQDSTRVEALDGTDYKTVPTGLFGNVGDTAVSRDGRLLAFYVNLSVNQYGACERSDPADPYAVENDACGPSAYGFRCDNSGRCARRESTVYLVDTKEKFRDKLGQNCSSSADCGPYQKCYNPDSNADRSRCVPGEVTVGALSQGRDRFSSCSIAEADPLLDYGDSRGIETLDGELSFDAANNIYVVANRDRSCLKRDFEHDTTGQIIRIDPTQRTSFDLKNRTAANIAYEPIEGMATDEAFDPSRCIDESQGITVDTCRIFVGEAHVSPKGREIAYSGTIPSASKGQARRALYPWHMLRDGSERWFTGDEQMPLERVTDLHVHPEPR